jgi:hypothetical protein
MLALFGHAAMYDPRPLLVLKRTSADRSKFIGSRCKHTVDENSESRGGTIFLVRPARDNPERIVWQRPL